MKASMRNTKESQASADKCAREHGFLCASYRGISNDGIIYEPRYSNSGIKLEEPTYIIINDAGTEFVSGLEYFDVLDSVKLRRFSKGKTIYKSLYQKIQEDNFICNDENNDEYDIVVSQMVMPEPWIEKNILYDYLEIADRLGMKLVLNPDCELINGNAIWKYNAILQYK